MRRLILLVCAAALALSMSAGTALAAPTDATNYWAIDATCDVLGEITIEVVNLGNWGAAKVQGTQTTLIPRWFTFDVIFQGDIVFSEGHAKTSTVDDVCRYSWTEVIPEDDPPFEAGTYLFEAEVGVKVVGG